MVKIGVIGYGNIGSMHVRNFESGVFSNVQLTAVFDIDSEKIKKYIAGYVVISMLGIFLFIKNISANVEGELSPFIPYKFYWQESNRYTL